MAPESCLLHEHITIYQWQNGRLRPLCSYYFIRFLEVSVAAIAR